LSRFMKVRFYEIFSTLNTNTIKINRQIHECLFEL